MKLSYLLFALALCLSVFGFAWFGNGMEQLRVDPTTAPLAAGPATGPLTSQTYPVGYFSDLKVIGNFHLIHDPAATGLTVRTQADVLPYVVVQPQGEQLLIALRATDELVLPTQPIEVVLDINRASRALSLRWQQAAGQITSREALAFTEAAFQFGPTVTGTLDLAGETLVLIDAIPDPKLLTGTVTDVRLTDPDGDYRLPALTATDVNISSPASAVQAYELNTQQITFRQRPAPDMTGTFRPDTIRVAAGARPTLTTPGITDKTHLPILLQGQ